jgi:hypothetical protein
LSYPSLYQQEPFMEVPRIQPSQRLLTAIVRRARDEFTHPVDLDGQTFLNVEMATRQAVHFIVRNSRDAANVFADLASVGRDIYIPNQDFLDSLSRQMAEGMSFVDFARELATAVVRDNLLAIPEIQRIEAARLNPAPA